MPLPLADALADERDPQVRRVLLNALRRVCGIDCGDDVADWKRFVEGRESPASPAVHSKASNDGYAHSDDTFYGVRLSTSRAMFVFDASGTMHAIAAQRGGDAKRPTYIDLASKELLKCLAAVDSGTRVNLCAFSATANRVWNGLRPATVANRRAIEHFVRNDLSLGGGTNLVAGLELAMSDDAVEELVLLSDGWHNCGEHAGDRAVLGWLARRNRFRRIPIHCVAFGVASPLLERIATTTGGQLSHP